MDIKFRRKNNSRHWGNDGTMIRSFSHDFDLAIVGDIDENAVDLNYQKIKEQKGGNIIPFLLDILQPTPSLGFDNGRDSQLSID